MLVFFDMPTGVGDVSNVLALNSTQKVDMPGSTAEDSVKKEETSIIERVATRLRTSYFPTVSSYLDTRFLFPNSDICGRCFAISGFTPTIREKGIVRSNLEAQLFLLMNR